MADPYPILALDIATMTGWALKASREAPAKYGSVRVGKGAELGPFLAGALDWFERAFAAWRPKWVVYEAPQLSATTNIQTLRKLYSLAALADVAAVRVAEREKIPGLIVREEYHSRVRRHFLGDGRPARPIPRGPKAEREADRREYRARLKSAVIAECRRRGWFPDDDNAADALALLAYAADLLDPEGAAARFELR